MASESEQVIKRDEFGVMSGGTIGLPRPMSRDIWLQEVFPEWSTYLNHEIDQFEVSPGTGALWYFGAAGYGFKTQDGAVFTLDLFSGPSLYTDYSYCGVCRQSGAPKIHWMRTHPMVIDPWKFKRWDAVFVSHHHQDHMCFHTIQAALQTSNATFVAPPVAAERMQKNMGVPADRLVVAEWGKSVKIKDMEVLFAPNFDVTAIRTGTDKPMAFKDCAVTYIFKTQGGNMAFLSDTHYHNGYKMLGDEYEIDVMSVNMGNNGPGYTDKASPWDVCRLAEATKAKVVLPCHFDNWANCHITPEIFEDLLPKLCKGSAKSVILLPGAQYVHPDDQDIGRYQYPCWTERMDWKKSWEYGYGDPNNPQGPY